MASPLFPTDTVKDIADSLGIVTLSSEAAKQLAMDVEFRIQEVVQEALMFMRHSKRTVLSPADISNALKSLNIEVLCCLLSANTFSSPCMDTILRDPSSLERLRLRMECNFTTWMMRKSSSKRL